MFADENSRASLAQLLFDDGCMMVVGGSGAVHERTCIEKVEHCLLQN
jgi:hypothetical protein